MTAELQNSARRLNRSAALRAGAALNRSIAAGAPQAIADQLQRRADRLTCLTGDGSYEDTLRYAEKLVAPPSVELCEYSPITTGWERCRAGRRLLLLLNGELGFFNPAPIENLIHQAAEVRLVVKSCPGGLLAVAMKLGTALHTSRSVGIVEGIAASAGADLLQFCGHRVMRRDSHLMLHEGMLFGALRRSELQTEAARLREMRGKLMSLYRHKTKRPSKEVAGWFKGPDRWFDASKALAAGLIDEISDAGG